jgi:hypothetical protein
LSFFIIIYYFLWHCSPARAVASCRRLWLPVASYGLLSRAMASSSARFLEHIQRRATGGRTPLVELSARRRNLYLTTHNRQTSMPPVGSEPTTATGERP